MQATQSSGDFASTENNGGAGEASTGTNGFLLPLTFSPFLSEQMGKYIDASSISLASMPFPVLLVATHMRNMSRLYGESGMVMGECYGGATTANMLYRSPLGYCGVLLQRGRYSR